MYSLICLMVLAANPYPELASDDYSVREEMTIKLCHEIVTEEIPEVYNNIVELTKSNDAEVKWRAKRILDYYFLPVELAGKVPIWSLPKRLRYKEDIDLANMYWFIAIGAEDVTYKNNSHYSRLGTRAYFLAEMESRRLSRNEAIEIINEMYDLLKTEQDLIRNHPLFYTMPSTIQETPSAIEDRIENIKISYDVINREEIPDYLYDWDFQNENY